MLRGTPKSVADMSGSRGTRIGVPLRVQYTRLRESGYVGIGLRLRAYSHAPRLTIIGNWFGSSR